MLDEFKVTYKAHNDFMDTAKREPINLEHAGETFDFGDADECAEFLRELIVLGYHVPDGVIDSVLEDDLLENI